MKLALALAFASPVAWAVPAAAKHAGLPHVPVSIVSKGMTHRFDTEVARTSAEQAQGLMFRTKLAPNAAMLFPMTPPRFASFWMKNTLIPLDLIFIRPNGTIHRIAAHAKPGDLSPIESYEPVAAVLEIAGGRAAQLGIREGDRVVSTALPRRPTGR